MTFTDNTSNEVRHLKGNQMYSKYTYASINEFLDICKELADKYGSEMVDEQSLSILTKDGTKIILPAKTIVDTACTIEVVQQFSHDMFCFLYGKHGTTSECVFILTTRNSVYRVMKNYREFEFQLLESIINNDKDIFQQAIECLKE